MLSWGGIAPTDTMRVSLAGPRDGDGVRKLIDCSFGAGLGDLTISSEALQLLPVGELQFESRVERSAMIEAGDYTITFTAGVVARTGDDATFDWAAGTVLLGR